ncbi:Protein of unknown function [Streptomyces zhaozhouensis]|uniref:DUF3995 domain-containing protein n=1 Tax=Streptomyces zhaozhouensis TaxID=1300267 RepID=A0A286DVC9_9ACTN|nr:DUF3995 domain-containing protein [Streptomyces zhaozhouensis]SOD62612.1 Protein of unknown function [Streptomyces zhaozhouensis]
MTASTAERPRGAKAPGRIFTTPPEHVRDPGGEKWWAYTAALWMLIFAGFHAYWALGGTFGLPPGETLRDNLPLFIIDIIAIPMNLGGAALALALVQRWGLHIRRFWLLLGGWGCAALMVVHALPAMFGLVEFWLDMRDTPLEGLERFSLLVYEPFWMLGGVLFAFASWYYQRRTRPVTP